MVVKWTGYSVDSLPFYTREATFVSSSLSCTPGLSEKGSAVTDKTLLTRVEHPFLLEYTSFQKGDKAFLTELPPMKPASVAHLDAPSDWRPGGRGFNPC